MAIWHSTYYTTPGRWRGPVVVTVYDMIHEIFSDMFHGDFYDRFRHTKRSCISRADMIICISESTAQDLIRYCNVDRARIRVVPLAHSELFDWCYPPAMDDNRPHGKDYLLFVGARNYYKGFVDLLSAYSNWRLNADVDLVVVGKSWTKSERAAIARLGLMGRIHLASNVDDRDLGNMYRHAAAFIYPSHYEGFGIPVLEALASGCPVVASDIPSFREVGGDSIAYFTPGDQEGMLDALNSTVSEGHDEAKRRRGVERAKRYSWDQTAAETLAAYRACC